VTRRIFHNGRMLIDDEVVDGQALVVENQRIADIVPAPSMPYGDRVDLMGRLLAPGFIDTQVNGGGGALFNDEPTPETIRTIGAAHRRFGTTGFLPTVISDDLHVLADAVSAAGAAMNAGVPGVLGVHVEGPFINVERSGVHDKAKVRRLRKADLGLLTGIKSGRTVVTLAPERVEPSMIERLVRAGVIVSVGHTDGSYEEIVQAFAAGASGVTHLFNAMSPLESRRPGAVGATLEDQQVWCGLIVDGRHIHPAVLKLALRSRPLERFMLVTDAMPTVGGESDSFVLQGREIRVVDGVCQAPDGTLAGSHLDMAQAVRNAIDMLGLTLSQAVNMASRQPAEFLGLGHELGRIAPGYRASLVALDSDLMVTDSWIDGLGVGER
jgi:N-acetylglucosamine-6-phosphate deacetylase